MAAGRNILSTITLLLLSTGAFCTIILIFQKTKVIDKLEYQEWYQVGAAAANTVVVIFLSYLMLTSGSRSTAYKMFFVTILIAGLITEIFLTNVFKNLNPQYPAYAVITFNLLVRMYSTVQFIQEPWNVVSLSTSDMGVSRTLPSVVEVPKTIVPPAVVKAEDEDARKFRDQFREIVRQAKEKVGRDNFDEIAKNKAYPEVIDPAVTARDFSRDRLKDAAKYLKDKSGNVIDLVFGGRKRR